MHSHAGPSSGPRVLRTIDVKPTSVEFSWSRPKWKQKVLGYMYLLLAQGHVIHSSTLGARRTFVSIDNLPRGICKYEFRVAGILEDGTFGGFPSSLRVKQTPSGEKKIIILYTCAFLDTINSECIPIYITSRSIHVYHSFSKKFNAPISLINN